MEEAALNDVQEILGEAFHVDGKSSDLRREVVVRHDGGNRGGQPHGSRDERFGNAGRHHGEVRGAGRSDALERVHDAPDRAEEADEWSRARRRGQDADVLFEARDLGVRRAKQRSLYVVDAFDRGGVRA